MTGLCGSRFYLPGRDQPGWTDFASKAGNHDLIGQREAIRMNAILSSLIDTGNQTDSKQRRRG